MCCLWEEQSSRNDIRNLSNRSGDGLYLADPPDVLHLALSLSCRLSSSLTGCSIFPLLQAAKPIRDLKASVPINYHPNQCRGLWYRIICQIIADGRGQVPLCHRPYPHGNFCSGWALSALPSLLMESLCAPGLQCSRLLLWIANISILAWPVDNAKSLGLL